MTNGNKNKRDSIIIIVLILVFITVFYVQGIFYNNGTDLNNVNNDYLISEKKKEELKKLINIDTLSQEFMDNYFEEVSNLSEQDNDNLLIVISKEKLDDTYGAYKVIEAPNNKYFFVYKTGEEKEIAFKKLQMNSNVVSVEKNEKIFVEQSADDFWFESPDGLIIDVNSKYNSWGVEQLGYDDAINAINSLKETEPDRIKDVVVGLIDTGLNVDVFNKYYKGKLLSTYNVLNSTTTMSDEHGHGTHTAGTIAETTPDNVKLTAIKASDSSGSFSSANLLAAIEYATNVGVDLISFSIGGYGSNAYYQSIEAAREKNIVFVASAGNDNSDAFHHPSDYDNVLSVSAVDYNLEKTNFSNYGNGVNFAAPGLLILSLNNITAPIDLRFASGTSMSTPHVAGAVAILKSFNKDLSLDESILLLKKNAIDINDDGWDQYYGHGVVNFNDVVFCNKNVVCDKYGVFENTETESLTTIRIEPVKKYVAKYNYGSNTNIVNAEIKLYYTNDDYYVKTLSQLIDNLEIIGYDPYLYEEQNVTIKYKNLETTLNVDNSSMSMGWEYNVLSDNTVELTSLNYEVCEINDSTKEFYVITDVPQVIYIPDEIDGMKVVKLGDGLFEEKYTTYKKNIKRLYIPSSITTIGQNAFKSDTSDKADRYNTLYFQVPIEIVFLGNQTISIDSSAFSLLYKLKKDANTSTIRNGKRGKVLFFSYENSFAHNYAVNNSFKYLYLDNIDIELLKDDIRVFDKINTNDLKVNVTYSGNVDSINETITDFEIKYNNGSDSISLEDTSFTVSFNTKIGHHVEQEYQLEGDVLPISVKKPKPVDKQYIYNGEKQKFELEGYDEGTMTISGEYRKNAGEQEVVITLKESNYMWEDETNDNVIFTFKIDKAIPEYVIPEGLTGKLNSQLSIVKLTEGFKWIDGTQELTEAGEKTFKATYTPKDVENYEIIENIDIPVLVEKNIVKPVVKIDDKIYDGTNNVDMDTIKVTNLDGIEYSILSVVLTSVDVGNTSAKVKIKLSDNSFRNYEFENGQQESEFTVDIKIVPLKISKPKLVEKQYIYNGEEQKIELEGYDEKTMTISNNYRKIAGKQDVVVSLKNSNYMWNDGTVDNVKFTFKIDKAKLNVEYKTSDKTIMYDGNSHYIEVEVIGNNDIKVNYMDGKGNYTEKVPSYINAGSYVVKYKLYIDENYTEITGENTLTINKLVIENNSVDYEAVYDGMEHSVSVNLNVKDYDIKYSVNNTEYNLNEVPKFKDVGEYTVSYKVTCDNCEELEGSNNVRIYGIRGFNKTLNVRDNMIVIKNNSFINIKDKIDVYSKETIFNHMDKNNEKVSSDIIKTGDVIGININNSKMIEYKLSIIGDINSDGKISSADYIKIRKHIMKSEIIKDKVYIYSADINNDEKISSADYIRIRKYIMNGDSL